MSWSNTSVATYLVFFAGSLSDGKESVETCSIEVELCLVVDVLLFDGVSGPFMNFARDPRLIPLRNNGFET